MPHLSLLELLRGSLLCLRRDVPRAYEAVCQTLPSAIAIVIDGEAVLVRFLSGRLLVSPGSFDASVTLTTSRHTVLALVDGQLSLLAAIRKDLLELRGNVTDLVRFDLTFRSYLSGAVRSPAFPALLSSFRKGAE